MKFPKPKKIKKTPLKRKADALFSKLTRSIGFCQAEGKLKGKCGGSLQTCHIEGRDNYRLRWQPENVLCMCAGHHRIAHTRPMEYIEFVLEYYPEKFNYVMQHKNEIVKTTPEFYQSLIQQFTL